MADETKDLNLEAEGDSTVETPVKTEEKRFTQKDLDEKIQNRLKKEKDTFTSAKLTWDQERSDMEAKISVFEESLKVDIEAKKKALPSIYLPLLEKLSVMDQYTFLKSLPEDEKLAKKLPIPATPQASETKEQNKTTANTKFKKIF
jgi:hypothetical protein